MKHIMAVLAVLAASHAPAYAGGDWDDDDSYSTYHWRDYRTSYSVPAYSVPAYEVYVPYASYVDEPDFYGPNCDVDRRWRHGRYTERIECDDD